MPCGIDFNLSSFKSMAISQASSLIGLAGTIGTPFGVLANIAQVQATVAAMKGNLLSMLPIGQLGDIAALASGGLRDQLGALANMVPGSGAALSKLTDIASEFTGITNLSGFANIDLNDITNSVFSLSGSFDPCSISIPNVFTDGAGDLQSLASSVLGIGKTDLAIDTTFMQEATSGLFSALDNNVDIGFGLGEFTTGLGDMSSGIGGFTSGLGGITSQLTSGMGDLTSQIAGGINVADMTSSATNLTSAFNDVTTGLPRALNTMEIGNTISNLQKNIMPSVSGMGDIIQSLPDGSQILRTKAMLQTEMMDNIAILTEA